MITNANIGKQKSALFLLSIIVFKNSRDAIFYSERMMMLFFNFGTVMYCDFEHPKGTTIE